MALNQVQQYLADREFIPAILPSIFSPLPYPGNVKLTALIYSIVNDDKRDFR